MKFLNTMLRTTTRRSSTLWNSIWCKQKLQDDKSSVRYYSGASIFSSKVICGECGSFYGQKIRHSNDPYRKLCGVATESSTESMCAKLRHWTLTKSKKSLLLRIISCSAIAKSCLKPASLCVKKLATALP